MAIRKNGENLVFSVEDGIFTPKQALRDKKIAVRFMKMAKKLKRIAPKASDFLYGHAIMMHAAEAALVDQNTGEQLCDDGQPVTATFESFKLNNGKESVKWKCSKEGILPYKNANGDIFPESELIKAHKSWVGKPLCKDHKSDSVDGIRGIVIDTYYDPKFKRVHALFALDKKNYGDLARKVETGYANCVSMGTAVGRSICTECGNVASTEREYCQCIRARNNYGEINLDLNPIELSLVVNGADGLAKIRNIVASMNNYVQQKQARIDELSNQRCVNPTELQSLADVVNEMQIKLKGLMHLEKVASLEALDVDKLGQLIATYRELKSEPGSQQQAKILMEKIKQLIGNDLPESLNEEPVDKKVWPPIRPGPGGATVSPMAGDGEGTYRTTTTPLSGITEQQRLASKEGDKQGAFSNELSLLRSKVDKMESSLNKLNKKVSKEENNMNSARLRARAKARRAYWLGGGGVNEPTPGKEKYPKEEADKIRDTEDKHMVGTVEMGSDGLYPGDEAKLKEVNRDGLNLSKAQLEDRAMKRRAYWLGGGGVNEPSPGKYPYDKDPMAEKVRDNEDKHLETYDMGGKDGTVPGDMETKKKLLRAKLRAKFTKVADKEGNLRKDASHWDVYAGDQLILSATGDEIYGEKLEDNWDYLNSKEYGKDVIKHIREDGFEHVAYLLKGAQPPVDPMAAPEAAAPEMAPAAPEATPEGPVEVSKPKEEAQGKIDTALNDMEEKIAEIRDLTSGMEEELVDIDVNIDEKDKGEAPAAPEASPMETTLASRENILKVESLMNDSADELALISEALEKAECVDGRILKAAGQALEDSKAIMAEADLILKAKKEKKEEKEDKKDKKGKMKKEEKEEEGEEEGEKKEEKEEKKEAAKMLEDALRIRSENRAALLRNALELKLEPGDVKEVEMAPADDDGVECPECKQSHPGKPCPSNLHEIAVMNDDGGCVGGDCAEDEDFVLESDESIKEARRKSREELVAQATDKILGKYELDLGKAQNATEKTYFEAHPGGKGTTTELTHTKTDEAKVETISEIHDAMRDVAESGPRNVREAAMKIQEAIVKGAFKVEDLDRLVAEGKVDAAAASYWKKYWSQGPDTGSFGADLAKEFSSKKKEASNESYKVKLRRAYDLGIIAQEKGLINSTRAALDTYVDEVIQLDDAAFESTRRIVANMNGSRTSGSLPRVGADAATEAMTVTASVEPKNTVSFNQLNDLGWK